MLLAGLGGLGAEVAKNLILAGVKGLTLLDHEQVHMLVQCTHEDMLRCSFSCPHQTGNLCIQLSTKHLCNILIVHECM